jgi:hypothetical protein
MIGIFKARAKPAASIDGPGPSTLAVRAAHGDAVPAGCIGLVCSRSGETRRQGAGAKFTLAQFDSAYLFYPGPFECELLPFAAAPEVGLKLRFLVDSPDPRVTQQRFDLFLHSEAGERLSLADFREVLETALQRELAQGHLELPPCTTLEEWNTFRAGFNELLYTRFGVTVEDCLPADLGESRDYARMLLDRAAAIPAQKASMPAAAPIPDLAQVQAADASALRRLFLELPCVMHGLRLAVLPPGQALFREHQALLQRLDLVSLGVNTMPALELASPGAPLADDEQRRRARHSAHASTALDEAWALLARLNAAQDEQLPALFDEADRIVANLEHATAARRAAA